MTGQRERSKGPFEVSEQEDLLQELQDRYSGRIEEARIKMLLQLKQHPDSTLEATAATIGSSERSVRRWWKQYVHGGLDVLLERGINTGDETHTLREEELWKLRSQLQRGSYENIAEIRDWIKQEFKVEYSLTTVSRLLREKLQARPMWTPGPDKGKWKKESGMRLQPGGEERPPVPDNVVEFLNRLPVTGETRPWIEQFRNALGALLGDVDRITVNINMSCNIWEPEYYAAHYAYTHHFVPRDIQEESREEIITTKSLDRKFNNKLSRGEVLLNDMRIQGFPAKDYHPPAIIDYYVEEKAYLGTIILWRSARKAAITQATHGLVNRLKPFITFMLSDCVARWQRSEPLGRVFRDAYIHFSKEAGLTRREREVFLQQLLGHSYDQIAKTLFISVDTVRKHAKSIHRKTGTRTYTELFGRYFLPFGKKPSDKS